MSFLLDTCVLSELPKSRPNAGVARWVEEEDESLLFVSALSMGELRKGIDKLADGQRKQAAQIATTLDLVGDKWTLQLIRDIGLFDKHRNKDVQDAAEKIPSSILANRLKRLVEDGLVKKRMYQEHPPRYEYYLTESGQGLLPVIRAMAKWADRLVDEVAIPDKIQSQPAGARLGVRRGGDQGHRALIVGTPSLGQQKAFVEREAGLG